MPLKKSASALAFKSNVKAEIAAGKPVKQAVAIAYNTKKMAQEKRMNKGGTVNKPAKANKMGRR